MWRSNNSLAYGARRERSVRPSVRVTSVEVGNKETMTRVVGESQGLGMALLEDVLEHLGVVAVECPFVD